MSVIVPTTRVDLTGLPIRPGGKVIDDTWQTLAQNAHLLYARGSVRIPIYWGDDAITTTSTSYVQPEPLDGITSTWRPTRLTANDRYRITLHVYGVDATLKITAYDATPSGGGVIGTSEAACGSAAEWSSSVLQVTAANVIDGSGDPIPIGLSYELKTSATTAEVYAIHAVATILTAATLP